MVPCPINQWEIVRRNVRHFISNELDEHCQERKEDTEEVVEKLDDSLDYGNASTSDPVTTAEEVIRKLGSEETKEELVQKAALSKWYPRRNQHQIDIKERRVL